MSELLSTEDFFTPVKYKNLAVYISFEVIVLASQEKTDKVLERDKRNVKISL